MIAERIWRWLGVATTVEVIGRINRVVLDARLLVVRLSNLENTISETSKRLTTLDKRINSLRDRLDKLNGTDAGEPRTGNDTTPTCESTASGTRLTPEEIDAVRRFRERKNG